MIHQPSFDVRIQAIRQSAEELAAILSEHPETDFHPATDREFWQVLDEIEIAGRARDEQRAIWLANLTQIDDVGPMGRDLILATAALAALTQIPDAAIEAGKSLWSLLPMNASKYRKIGVCKVLDASGSAEAIPILEQLSHDPDDQVRKEAVLVLHRLRVREAYAEPDGTGGADLHQ